ncbi:peptidoglycan DD-metalloendopeptidase family protein [Thermophagus sp. OGC60D27]|uniref:peptidoglycan DD-metalloendopeptidase family protein n=1 Tax=Thermophagus sp. OGC60D27 TaxID=3458415 RepID=UPI004038286D
MKRKYIPGLILLFIVGFSLFWCHRQFSGIKTPDTTQLADSVQLNIAPSPPPETLYGIVKDSFEIETGTIRYAQSLATILSSYNVDYSVIHGLAQASKKVFDVRKMKTGNSYTVFSRMKDSLKVPTWFVYEIDPIEYMVMSLKGDTTVYREKKTVTLKRKNTVGVIETSLWNTINENDLNPYLALDLSDIFAWTVDFFGLEKGDRFSVIYDEQFIDSIPVRIGHIYAACFHHRGTPYYAFRYEQDSAFSFFDEKGASLKKAFLKAPLKFSRISSRFTNSRLHPILKIRRPHHGVDYAAAAGTPVYALGDGRVTHKGWDTKGGGNYIKIRHNSVYTTVYMHLSGFAKGLKKGMNVTQGQLIGYVGSTGMATGPHLDFRVYKNGRPIDPLTIKAPPVAPIHEEKMQEYMNFIAPWKERLDSLTFSHQLNPDSVFVGLGPLL